MESISEYVQHAEYTNDTERRYAFLRMIESVSLSHVLALISDICSTESESMRQAGDPPSRAIPWEEAAECMAAASVNVNV